MWQKFGQIRYEHIIPVTCRRIPFLVVPFSFEIVNDFHRLYSNWFPNYQPKKQGGAPYIKGLSQDGGQRLRESSLNKELSKGTTFSLIYLAGQYPYNVTKQWKSKFYSIFLLVDGSQKLTDPSSCCSPTFIGTLKIFQLLTWPNFRVGARLGSELYKSRSTKLHISF